MRFAELLDQFSAGAVGKCAYGDPFQTPDGATVITVARVRGGSAERHPVVARAADVTVSRCSVGRPGRICHLRLRVRCGIAGIG